jgi:hypothetical protein
MSAPQHPPQQHDDPVGEARTQLMQALAVAATVGEAGARWVAVGLQQRAARVEQAERAARVTGEQAARMSGAELSDEERSVREQIDRAFTDWLDKADLADTARVWRTSAVAAAAGNLRAQEAMGRAEARLRRMHPGLMYAYDTHRAAGRGPAEAMRAAAYTAWEAEARAYPGSRAHPHGGPAPDRLRAGAAGRALGPAGPVVDAMDAAVRTEVGRLAEHVSPEALDQLQRQWRAEGKAPAANAANLLAQYARQARISGTLPPVVADGLEATARRASAARGGDAAEADGRHLSGYAGAERRAGTIDDGSPDLTGTPADEHDAGLVAGVAAHGAADHDATGAAQRRRMAQAFPRLTRVGGTDPVVAGKQAAQVVPTKRLGRGR